MTTRIAPKPDNFDELSRTWDDPEAFARAQAKYYAQICAIAPKYPDITEPLQTKHGTDGGDE